MNWLPDIVELYREESQKMEKITLFTHCGPGPRGMGTLSKVVDVLVPAFVTPPDVIQWGARTFSLQSISGNPYWIECCMIAAVQHIDLHGKIVSSL